MEPSNFCVLSGTEVDVAGRIQEQRECTRVDVVCESEDDDCVCVLCPFEKNESQNLLAESKHNMVSTISSELHEGIQAVQELLCGAQLDLLEVCAPWDSPLSQAVKEEGGRAMTIGLHNGFDLTTRSGLRKALRLVREKRPRYMHVSPPCFPWTPLQNLNQRTPEQRKRLEDLRNTHRRLLHNCRRLVEVQVMELNGHCGSDGFEEGTIQSHKKGQGLHHAGAEHPLRAISWGLSDMRAVVRLCGGERFRVDGCCHGLQNVETGNLFQKSWGWCSTHDKIRKAIEGVCRHEPHEHDRVEGKHSAKTAVYPYLLCRRFARTLMQDLEALFPVFSSEDSQENPYFENLRPMEERSSPLDLDAEDSEVELEVPEQNPGPPPAANPAAELTGAEMKTKLRTIHRNLGHPCNSTLLRMLRDAGASAEVLTEAQNFECPECLQRGRRSSSQTVAPVSIREKWHTVSVDTFWWKYPESVVGKDQQNTHVVGVSIFDEATDFQTAVIVRSGKGGAMHNVSGEEFNKAFSEGWLQRYPAPSVLRYDEEGFFRGLQVKTFLEQFGMKLGPIAGESAWQLGKHSRHLQTLKEQMNLLASELGVSFLPHQILSLALSAKNSLHNVRGYSPNQWAFGKSHSRIASFLQQYDNLPLQAQRQEPDFEEALQAETKAQKLFLEADAKRRLARALRHRCRPLKEFQTGQLVYYFRKGRKEGSRYGGKWYGPARVLCHEKTTLEEGRQHAGSIVWLSHAGVLLRCSPEQLRPVTRDLSSVDKEINGPRDFHSLMKQISQQQRFLDLTEKFDSTIEPEITLDEDDTTRYRLNAKRPAHELYQPPLPPLNEDSLENWPHERERRLEGTLPPHPRGEGGRERECSRENEPRGSGPDDRHLRQGSHPQDLFPDIPGQGLREVVRRTCEPGDRQGGHQEVPDLHPSHDAERGTKRRPSKTTTELQAEQRLPEGLNAEEGGGGRSRRLSGERDELRMGWDRDHQDRDAGGRNDEHSLPTGSSRRPSTTHGSNGGDAPGDCILHARAQSDRQEELRGLRACLRPGLKEAYDFHTSHHVAFADQNRKYDMNDFVSLVDNLPVLELHFVIAPRDIHTKRGVWTLNQKVKKHAEVIYRQLSEKDKKDFDVAMKKEIDSYVSSEAVRICESHGIPPERIMQMRWVHTWKVETDGQGNETGKRAKARLIVKGFQDPRLLELPRESPTLSTLGRNLILSHSARHRSPLAAGDIKTAFLQGSQSELGEEIYGLPPAEVRAQLNMTPTQVLRIAKAIYGLLNAPKAWNESLCEFLRSDGWIQHQLDQCLFKRVENNRVTGLLGIHVDDILTTGCGSDYEQALERLQKRFRFGTWERAQETVITYCGCEIRQDADFGIRVQQEKFGQDLNEIVLSQERRAQSPEPITNEERTEMRQKLGALNWRATQTAPWLLATVSILQGCVEKGIVSDLLAVNKLIRLQRKHGKDGLYFPPMSDDVTVITFTDASWATRRDNSSQGGQITLLMDKSVLQGCKTPFHVLSWTSKRLKRVARSSTSAETQMCANALDLHEFAKLSFLEIQAPQRLNLSQADEYLRTLRSCLIVDAKNIFDACVKIESSGLQMEERRTAIELLAVKQRLQQASVDMRWVNGDQQLSDAMTKPWVHEILLKAMRECSWRIVFDPTYQSAKRARALKNAGQNPEMYILYCLWDLATETPQEARRFLGLCNFSDVCAWCSCLLLWVDDTWGPILMILAQDGLPFLTTSDRA